MMRKFGQLQSVLCAAKAFRAPISTSPSWCVSWASYFNSTIQKRFVYVSRGWLNVWPRIHAHRRSVCAMCWAESSTTRTRTTAKRRASRSTNCVLAPFVLCWMCSRGPVWFRFSISSPPGEATYEVRATVSEAVQFAIRWAWSPVLRSRQQRLYRSTPLA